jgi:TRAP transporter TAXI family solute receptor
MLHPSLLLRKRANRFQWTLLLAFAISILAGTSGTAQETGIQVKKPVFGGACKACPWGAMADIVKAAMKPYGYDVQVCYTCSGMDATRIVAGAKVGPAPRPNQEQLPVPKGPVDFGATALHFLWAAYQGAGNYASDGPMKNLRLLATIQDPLWLVVAVKADSGITDLRQIKEKKIPVRLIGNSEYAPAVMEYFGITAKDLESWGGRVLGRLAPEAQAHTEFDVVIGEATRGLPPEFSLFHEISETANLKYLDLPEDLLAQMAKKYELERQNIPAGLLRGVDRTIPTVARTGTVIYGRADMPEDFAYAVAKALDEQQDLFQWSNNTFSYNRFRVAKAFSVPLHPGAERYYREKGYMK